VLSSRCVVLHGDFINGFHLRLGATGTNPNVPATTCLCRRHIKGSDIKHTMICNRLSGGHLHKQGHWQEPLVSILACAGCNSRKNPSITSVSISVLDYQGAREGGEHSAPFACTVLTRDYGDTFGSSATTGGLLFHSCILFSVYHLFYRCQRKRFAR
jgi:hypothetical protein